MRLSLTTAALVAAALLVPSGTARADSPGPPADDGAKITGETWLDPRMVDLTVSSPALGESTKVRVIVPAAWSATTTRTFPVVYTYQGGRDDYTSWTRNTDIESLAAGHDAMIVMPDGGYAGSYTDWFNYGFGGTPKWETFHTSEVVQLMERDLHASGRRAAMGISSGAAGAITYAARHPAMFQYAASFSGLLHLATPSIQSLLLTLAGVAGNVSDPLAIWGIPGVNQANWLAHDPYALVSKLRGTGLFVSSGTSGLPGPYDPSDPSLQNIVSDIVGGLGEALIGTTNTAFVAELHRQNIPVTADLYGNGLHAWPDWVHELHSAWPAMMQAIGAQPT